MGAAMARYTRASILEGPGVIKILDGGKSSPIGWVMMRVLAAARGHAAIFGEIGQMQQKRGRRARPRGIVSLKEECLVNDQNVGRRSNEGVICGLSGCRGAKVGTRKPGCGHG